MKNQNLIRFPAQASGASTSRSSEPRDQRPPPEIHDLLQEVPDLQDRMADVIEGLGDGFALYDRDDKLILWNQKFADIVHYARDELRPGVSYETVLRKCADHHFINMGISAEEQEAWVQQAMAFQRNEGTYERQTHDGRHFLVARRRTRQGYVAVVWSEITAQRKAELAASENEAIYRQLFEGSVLGIALLDRRGFKLSNPAFRSMFGYQSEDKFKTLKDLDRLLAPPERDRVRALLRDVLDDELTAVNTELRCICRNGRAIWVHASASRVNWQGKAVVQATFLDVTEKKEFQEQLLTRNLESMGALAHGIAMEFHKAFSGVMAQMKLASMEAYAVGMDQIAELLDDADRQGGEVYGMIERLLYLSTGGVPVKTNTTVEALINEAIPMAESGSNVVPLRKARIRYKIDIKGGLPGVRVDRSQMVAALGSLIAKGVQSMRFGGTLAISADDFSVDDRTQRVKLPQGRYARITINDEGGGLDPSVLERYFDPYITSPHKGGGLALSSAYSIVRNHGGAIAVTSRGGKGTRVQVFLPVERSRHSKRS